MERLTAVTAGNRHKDVAFAGTGPADAPLAASVDRPGRITETVPATFEWITTTEGLAELETEWNDLYAALADGPSLFQSHAWCSAWWRGLSQDEPSVRNVRLRVLTGRTDRGLALVWPLAIMRAKGLDVLVWAGTPLIQYGNVLLADGPDRCRILTSAWKLVRRLPGVDFVNLRKVREDSTVYRLLSSVSVCLGDGETAPYIGLSTYPAWEDYRAILRKKSRKQQDRFRRNLEKAGEVSFEVLSGVNAVALIEPAVRMKENWLADTGRVSDALADRRTISGLETFARANDPNCQCVAAALRLDGKPVALEIGIRSFGYYCSFLGTYAPDMAKFRPGSLQLESMIRWAHGEGMDVFDLLAPDDQYKQRWSDSGVRVFDFGASGSLLGGLYLHVYLRRLRSLFKKLYYAVPSGPRRFLLRLIERIR